MVTKLTEFRYKLCDVFIILKNNLSAINPSLDDLNKIASSMNDIMDVLEKYDNCNTGHIKSLIIYELDLRRN